MATTTTAAPSDPQAAYSAALQALIAAATADLAAGGMTAAQETATRDVLARAQASLLLQQTEATQSTTTYTVTAGDLDTGGIFGIAQRLLGDDQRFGDILDASGLRFIALQAGQVLTIPAT